MAESIYPGAARSVALYEGLRRIDEDLAENVRSRGCPRCGGPLDAAGWIRRPKGGDRPRRLVWRHGLCCRSCRRRVLPPSTRFLGRKVYWGAVVLISVVVRQRRTAGATAEALRRRFGVSRATLQRWLEFFATEFPASPAWKVLRGHVPASVRDEELPSTLLALFDERFGEGEPALTACLRSMAGGTMAAA